jgi:hypothetical protein
MVGLLAGIALAALVAACQLAPSPSEPAEITCASWLETPEPARLALADAIVGDAPERLEAIRIAQHRPPGTERDALIRDVGASLTKNCEILQASTRTVRDLMEALYPVPS